MKLWLIVLFNLFWGQRSSGELCMGAVSGEAVCSAKKVLCQCLGVCWKCSFLSCCDPMDCSLPISSVHGIFHVRMLEWIAVPFSRGSSRPRDRTQVSCIAGRFFTIWATREAWFGSLGVDAYTWKRCPAGMCPLGWGHSEAAVWGLGRGRGGGH